jgi:hypothetical protein
VPKPFGKSFWQSVRAPFVAVKCRICYIPVPAGPRAAAAAALTFRTSADASAHYSMNVDAAGLVKLWRPGRDVAVYPTPIVRGRTYHLKVVASGVARAADGQRLPAVRSCPAGRTP